MNMHRVPSQRSMSGTAGVCEYCGCSIDEGVGVDVVVPDSGYLHRDDPRHDGNRPTRVCSSNHARELIADGNRLWADAQFWANKLIRVSGHWNRDELDGIAERAGLTRSQLARALHWHRSRSTHRFTDQLDELRNGDDARRGQAHE